MGITINTEKTLFRNYIKKSAPKAWFVQQGTKLVLAVTGLRGVGSAAEDLLCGRLGEEPAKNLARRGLSAGTLFEWPWRNQKAGSAVPVRWDDARLTKCWRSHQL